MLHPQPPSIFDAGISFDEYERRLRAWHTWRLVRSGKRCHLATARITPALAAARCAGTTAAPRVNANPGRSCSGRGRCQGPRRCARGHRDLQ
jgi:hypothetical protein